MDIQLGAHLLNVLGSGFMVLIAVALGWRYPSPFSKPWVFGFGAMSLFICGEAWAHVAGRSVPLTVAEVLVISLAVWNFVVTANLAQDIGQPSRRAALAVWFGWAVATGLALAGQPMEVATCPIMLTITWAVIRLGWVFLRRLPPDRQVPGARLVGWTAVVLGAWPFIWPYPIFVNTRYAWIGYGGSGVLHVILGLAMTIYLVDLSWAGYKRAQEQVTQVKNDFVSIVSHELRSPLTAAIGYAEFLEEELAGPLTEAQREYLTEIQRGHHRLRRLVDDLLDFSLAEAGTLKLERAPVDLGELVLATVETQQILAGRAGLTLTGRRPSAELGAWVDRGRIEQVMLNLIGNAIKFTPEGGTVNVACRTEGDRHLIAVSDSGVGIDAADLPHLFDKFFQASGGPRRARGGAGLGLAVARAIVEAHGGTIAVDSRPGEGTCFTIALPAYAASQPVPGPIAQPDALTS